MIKCKGPLGNGGLFFDEKKTGNANPVFLSRSKIVSVVLLAGIFHNDVTGLMGAAIGMVRPVDYAPPGFIDVFPLELQPVAFIYRIGDGGGNIRIVGDFDFRPGIHLDYEKLMAWRFQIGR